jgi:hypothetical protein
MLADLPVGSIIKLSLLLVALIVIGWVTVWQVRRRLTSPDETSGVGFTLSDLRQLHKSGQMSDEEFERAKAKVVDAARRVAEREKAAAAGAARPGGARPGDLRAGELRPDDFRRPPRDGTGNP